MTLHLYQDASREWRWRLKARNGNILADSGEGYKRKQAAVRIARRLFPSVPINGSPPV